MNDITMSFKDKKVLITGLTGFKGSWLTSWLIMLGASVVGISKDVPTQPSFFVDLEVSKKVKHFFGDINDFIFVQDIVRKEKPDFCFHLAAQAIVSESYRNPLDTLTTNAIGTANLLEAFRHVEFNCNVVFITSDKCYENVEWKWGYRENDLLGGKDPYSVSKAMAELSFKTYYQAFFKDHPYVRIATARAGNVIGGGDWAKDRIVPDAMKSWSNNQSVGIRSPKATRPWQHVLEPLSGYLLLATQLSKGNCVGESYNFGPPAENNFNVLTLLTQLASHWKLYDQKSIYDIQDIIPFNEAGLLKLNCDKALFDMNWTPTLNFEETVEMTSQWYYSFYNETVDMFDFTLNQISFYQNKFQHALNKEKKCVKA